jgi:hypothetical protein
VPQLLKPCFFCTLALLCVQIVLPAQDTPFDTTTVSPRPDSSVSLSDLRLFATPEDTTVFSYYLIGDLTTAHISADTLADDHWRWVDPSRRANHFDHATLGNLGSAARPLWFQNRPRQGFDVGHHVFDLYKVYPDSLRFVRNERSFTDVTYYQGGGQNESALKARFGRTFAGGLNMALEYKNINHEGSYQYQRAKHNAIQFGFWLPMGKRYEAVLTYGRNTHEQEENGGIPNDSLFGTGPFAGPLNLLTAFEKRTAGTRHADQCLRYYHTYQLAGRSGKTGLQLSHLAQYQNATYKFSFIAPTSKDSLVFPVYFSDKRGVRNFIHTRLITNEFGLNFTLKSKKDDALATGLFAGVEHRLIRLNQEPENGVRQQMFAVSRLQTQIAKRVLVDANGAFGLLYALGEYRIAGTGALDLSKLGSFKFNLLNQRTQATIIQAKTIVTFDTLWARQFTKPIESSLSAVYTLPFAGLESEAASHLTTGLIYFDTLGFARQHTVPVQVFQLRLRQILHYRSIYLDYHIGLQSTAQSEVLRLPNWMAKGSLTYRGWAFKRHALLYTGVSARVNSPVKYDQWLPVTGQFILQDQREFATYPWLDLFFDMKVKRFRAFFSYENLAALWQNKLHYQTAFMPWAPGQVRVGIGWRFSDPNISTPANSGTQGVPPASGRQNARPF